jgi:hypothetical protein
MIHFNRLRINHRVAHILLPDTVKLILRSDLPLGASRNSLLGQAHFPPSIFPLGAIHDGNGL